MFTYILYGCAGIGLLISFAKSKQKTKMALKKAWKSFENILPQFLIVILLIGIMLSIVSAETITKFIGEESGFWGVLVASIVGSITLIPGFVAFPLASALMENGAGIMQIVAFVSTLMMVGVITIPIESKTFGKKVTIVRNISALCFSLLAAVIMGVLL